VPTHHQKFPRRPSVALQEKGRRQRRKPVIEELVQAVADSAQ
jgi:hypothetical protein